MRKMIVALIILATILTAGILEHFYIEKTFEQLDNRLSQIEQALHNENPDALDMTKDLSVWWNKKRKCMELFTYSPDLRAFSVALAEQEGSLEGGDYVNALSKCQSLIAMSHNLHDILDFNLQDVI